MELQLQADKASCFITAISMVIDKPVAEVIEAVGKEHMKILHPGREGSMKYRGHHPQDFTEYLQNNGWCISINYAKVPIFHMHIKNCMMCGGKGKFKGRTEEFNLLTEGNVGILQYANHACAWDGEMVFDPNGTTYEFHTTRLIGFHPLYRIANHEKVPD